LRTTLLNRFQIFFQLPELPGLPPGERRRFNKTKPPIASKPNFCLQGASQQKPIHSVKIEHTLGGLAFKVSLPTYFYQKKYF